MRFRCLLACALLTQSAALNAQVATQPALEGLWTAKNRYGPDIRGRLIIARRGSSLIADMSGFQLPVARSEDTLSFDLPDAQGRFRGRLSTGVIEGQWTQATTRSSGNAFMTPIVLHADARGHWIGEVRPLDDAMTYFLPLKASGVGRFDTFLRNPERNQGIFMGASRLELDKDGEVVRLIGTRRGQEDERVLATGRLDSDSGLLRIPFNGETFNFARDRDTHSAFYPRGNPPDRYRYSPPLALGDGWPVSTLAKEGIDQGLIERFVQKLIDMPMGGISTSQIHSVLIARHGKVVLEEYFHGADRDTPHDLRSASKSWTNILIGAAMQAGIPIRLDTPVYQTLLGALPADLDPRKKAMTLEHLIGMTAGFDCNDSGERPGDEDVFQSQDKEPDWTRYMLNVPMAWNSGDKIVYCSGKPNLAAAMLEKIAGEPLPELFWRLVAEPMRMSNYGLFLTPTGTAYGGGGHRFTTRDFAKWSQLYLNDGVWEGRKIVGKDWVRQSTAPLRLLNPKSGQTYGFLWNSVSYDFHGKKLHAFFPGGNGGQVAIAIPDLDLVIAFTGGNYADQILFRSQREFVPQDILPAIH